jgi:hypothetical protein
MDNNRVILLFAASILTISGVSYLLHDNISDRIKLNILEKTNTDISKKVIETDIVVKKENVVVPKTNEIGIIPFQDKASQDLSKESYIDPHSAYIHTDFPGGFRLDDFMSFPSENKVTLDGYTIHVPEFIRKN